MLKLLKWGWGGGRIIAVMEDDMVSFKLLQGLRPLMWGLLLHNKELAVYPPPPPHVRCSLGRLLVLHGKMIVGGKVSV